MKRKHGAFNNILVKAIQELRPQAILRVMTRKKEHKKK